MVFYVYGDGLVGLGRLPKAGILQSIKCQQQQQRRITFSSRRLNFIVARMGNKNSGSPNGWMDSPAVRARRLLLFIWYRIGLLISYPAAGKLWVGWRLSLNGTGCRLALQKLGCCPKPLWMPVRLSLVFTCIQCNFHVQQLRFVAIAINREYNIYIHRTNKYDMRAVTSHNIHYSDSLQGKMR